MSATATLERTRSLYRVDSFIVPRAARDAFLERLFIIRDLLADQPGCVFNRIAEAETEDGQVRMITMVEWRDQRAMNNARENAAAYYRESGFDPQAFMQRLGVKPDLGTYRDIAG